MLEPDQAEALADAGLDCYGANSIVCGEQLLTTANPATGHGRALFERLGLTPAA